MVGRPSIRLPPVALETSPREARTGPRRSRSAIDGLDRPARRRVGRGAGRPAHPAPRRRHRVPHAARPGGRHSVAGHVSARSCSTRCPPLVRGRQRGRARQAQYYAPRGTLSLARHARSGPSASASCSPGSSSAASCWQPRGCSTRRGSAGCRSCPAWSAWSAAELRRRARRRRERPAPLARRSPSRSAYAAVQGTPRRGRGDRPRSSASTATSDVDVIVIARGRRGASRTCCPSPTRA